jgi:hypothetical protein
VLREVLGESCAARELQLDEAGDQVKNPGDVEAEPIAEARPSSEGKKMESRKHKRPAKEGKKGMFLPIHDKKENTEQL